MMNRRRAMIISLCLMLILLYLNSWIPFTISASYPTQLPYLMATPSPTLQYHSWLPAVRRINLHPYQPLPTPTPRYDSP